jgi:hypothetical protein
VSRSTVAAAPVLALVLLLGACGGGGDASGDDPARSVEAMMRALDAGDCDAVKEVVLTPSEIDCGFVADLGGMFADEGLDLEKVDFSVTERSGDQATVEIDWGDGDPAETYEVQRVDGRWKVLFDSAA